MNVIVRKPTEDEKAKMLSQPTWGCGVSKFDWHYGSEETALIIEGEVTVNHDGRSALIQTGDYVVFPKGLSCVWDVTKPINKHYLLGN